MMVQAEDINRRAGRLGLEFTLGREAGGHWVLRHAGAVALFLGTNEAAAARDCRIFMNGITHVARHTPTAPEACRRLTERLEAIMAEPDPPPPTPEQLAAIAEEEPLPGWIVR